MLILKTRHKSVEISEGSGEETAAVGMQKHSKMELDEQPFNLQQIYAGMVELVDT